MIDKFTEQRILASADIVDVVGSFVELKKKGARYLGLCPFHGGQHLGSFVVHPAKNCYRCFSCNEKGGAVQFVMKHCGMNYPDALRWLGSRYGIAVDDKEVAVQVMPVRKLPPALPMLELPMRMVESKECLEGDNLVGWIKSGIKWDGVQRSRIDDVLKEYHVGHSKHGHTMFWQIDEAGVVRTGKMMKYKADGHRDKEVKWNFDWVHSALFRDERLREYDEEKLECKPTLFGMHLLEKYPKADVCIVESEKTAVLMAIAYGNHASQVWMACGGKEMLTDARLAPITKKNRRVIVYPDRDGVDGWKKKVRDIGYIRMAVDARAVTEWWKECDGEKADIADVVVRSLNEK